MARVQPSALPQHKRDEALELLWSSISSLSSPGEVENFFGELLSDSEALMLARRIQVASLLLRGYSYEDVLEKVGVGRTTITSVNKWLQRLSAGERKLVSQLEEKVAREHYKKDKRKMSASHPFSLEHLKKKYPLHFLLFHIADEIDFKSQRKKGKR